MKNVLFILGGNDGEMMVVKGLLSQFGVRFVQPNSGWGEHKYSTCDLGLKVITPPQQTNPYGGCEPLPYISGIESVVFVECQNEGYWPKGTKVVVVDHHGENSSRPASVLQVIRLLESEAYGPRYGTDDRIKTEEAAAKAAVKISDATRRWVELVAANDAGYIPAMVAIGATAEEIERVRALDRSAQGVTPAHEAEALRALANKEVTGRLTVIRMAHSKCATVTDRLYGRYDQLLILSGDGETNFYGDGALCAALKEKFEGWNGGSGLGKAGETAYWGGYPNQKEVLNFIQQQIS